MKNETKLKKLVKWLDENNFSHFVPHSYSKGVKGSSNLIILPVGKYKINVKIEGEDDVLFYERHKAHHPVFIRDSETPKFVLEKVQNVIIELMKKQNALEQLSPSERSKLEKRREKRKRYKINKKQKLNSTEEEI